MIEGLFGEDVAVALGLGDRPGGATLEDDVVLLTSAALGGSVPDASRLDAVSRFAKRFPSPVHRNRRGKVREELRLQASNHGRTLRAEVRERVKGAVVMGLFSTSGQRPLPGLVSAPLGDVAELRTRVRRLLNRLVTEDLIGPWDDAARRVALDDVEDAIGGAHPALVAHTIATTGSDLADDPESGRLANEMLIEVARQADLSDIETVALLLMLEGGQPADLAAARRIKPNYAQQVFFRTRKKVAARFSSDSFRRARSM